MNSFSPEAKKTKLGYKEKADINRVLPHFSFSFNRERIGNMVKKKKKRLKTTTTAMQKKCPINVN